MAKFSYKGRDSGGNIVAGLLTAESKDEVLKILSERGIIPFAVETVGENRGGLKRELVIDFSDKLSELLRSGVPLHDALTLLSEIEDNKFFFLDDLKSNISSGIDFSDALKNLSVDFPKGYTDVIKAAEKSGRLADALSMLADEYENEERFVSGIAQAVIYPAIIALFGLLTLFILFVYVVPKIESIYADTNMKLPFITELILVAGKYAVRFFPFVLFFILFFIIALFVRKIRTGIFSFLLLKFLPKLPVIGDLISDARYYKVYSSLALMFKNGVSVVDALGVAAGMSGIGRLGESLSNILSGVKGGRTISDAMDAEGLPRFDAGIVKVGERGGNYAGSFSRLAGMYEKSIEKKEKIILNLLEPLMILFIGAFIGIIIIALLVPIFNISLTM